MTDTIFELDKADKADRDTAAPGPWQCAANREIWHAPQSAWHLYTLSVLTLGLWLSHWAEIVAEDLRRNRDGPLELRNYARGLVNRIFGWRYLWDLARAIHALENPATSGEKRFPLFVALSGSVTIFLFWIAFVAYLGGVILNGLIPLDPFYPVYPLLGALLLLPLPFVVLQARLNRFKDGLSDPIWTKTPYRFGRDQGAMATLTIAVVWLLIGANFWPQVFSPSYWQGDTLAASVPIRGESGLYTLTPPDDDWVRVGRDLYYDGTDLSLSGPGHKTTIVVWIKCDGESVEERVRFRRGERKNAFGWAQIEERRELLEKPFVPISYARYHQIWIGIKPIVSFAATIAQGDVLVEVIGETLSAETDGESLEALVRSLQVNVEATSCSGS